MISYGTAEAVARLADTYSDMLLRLAATRLRHTADAEDAVQEVFLYLLEHGVTFKNETHEKAWLIRATLHRAADLQKRAAKKRPAAGGGARARRAGGYPSASASRTVFFALIVRMVSQGASAIRERSWSPSSRYSRILSAPGKKIPISRSSFS